MLASGGSGAAGSPAAPWYPDRSCSLRNTSRGLWGQYEGVQQLLQPSTMLRTERIEMETRAVKASIDAVNMHDNAGQLEKQLIRTNKQLDAQPLSHRERDVRVERQSVCGDAVHRRV